MNNLKPQIVEEIVSSDLLSDIKCMTIDTDLNVIYCVNQSNQLISVNISERSWKKCCDISVDNNFEVICVEFLSEERMVCMISNTGEIVAFNSLTETTETVGTLSKTLESVSFSLDQELIVLLTQNNSMILMNKLFDVLSQRDLNTEDFGCNPSVSVNWGSKLTQFHGEGKRDVRAQQENFKTFSDFDDKKSRISWRADGLYFVTSYFVSSLNYRKLQIWNREAVLQYTGEQISGLEHHISWNPSGTVIATSQMLPNKHMIVFIEKNGLKHREFELPFPPNSFKLEVILWSNDSQILLILGTNTDPNDCRQILMLWRQTNYKWDLKQCLSFKENSIKNTIWDPIDANLLHIVLSNGKYMRYRWKWSVDVSQGTVGVIDGRQLKLTNFEKSVIPPPFFSYSLDFESEIRQICFSTNKLAVILSDETLFLFKKVPKITKSDSKDFSITFDNFNEENEEIFECFYSNKCQNISRLTNLLITESGLLFGEELKHLYLFDFQNECQKITEVFNLKFNVMAISCLDDTLALVSDDGHLWKVDLKNKTLNQWMDRNSKWITCCQQCSRIQLFKIDDKISALCLTENFTFSSDNEVLSQNNCNSFVTFDDRFILFTTTDHLMHFWPIGDNVFDAHNCYLNYKPRSVERGSKIITSTSDGKIVLQMPRGNLEAIYPRPLLLDLIKLKLDNLDFDSAFDLLRKHRINLNLLYDYNPKLFIENIQLFIEKIGNKSIEWICLFLTDLSDQDFYAKMTQTSEQNVTKNWSIKCQERQKVNLICDLMREIMDGLDSHKYLNPILLTYIKKSESEIGSALKRIKSIDNVLIRDKAIKFLLYSININTLLDEAFGSYDFDIFLMIASKSQKDPKEYLALLEDINKIESFDYRCYKIDIHLKRYKKALIHISKCDQHFEECLDLIRNHSLYRNSVLLFDDSSEEKKKRVWKLYAEYLFEKKYFEESAIAFRKCDDLLNAVKAYQLCDNWSAAIECAVHCPAINVENLARNLSKQLISIGKHLDASYLLHSYANDCKQSIITLIDGHEWEHSLRLMSTNDSPDLLEYFKTQLLSHFESIDILIETNCNLLSKYMNRLEIVRQKQNQRNSEFKCSDNFDEKSEIYSETNSWAESKSGSQKSNSSSLLTKKSKKSAKKSEKKKYFLKEGSNDENIQLIYAIKELMIITDQIQEEVHLLLKTLFKFDYSNQSKKIQNDFNLLLNLIKEIIEEIWSPNVNELTAPKYVISDPELIKAPELRKIDWKLALI